MGIALILIGILFILTGVFLIVKILWMLLKSLFTFFLPEKKLDEKLFNIWKKENGYRNFEKNIGKGI